MRVKLLVMVALWVGNGLAAVHTISLGIKADAAVRQYQEADAQVSELTIQAAKSRALYTTQQYAKSHGYTNGRSVYIAPGS